MGAGGAGMGAGMGAWGAGVGAWGVDVLVLLNVAVCSFILSMPCAAVKCLECMKHSDTFDPMLDLSLDIKTCPSIEKALHKAIHPDVLDGSNQYACPKSVPVHATYICIICVCTHNNGIGMHARTTVW